MGDIVEALVKEANELPDPNRSLLTHNERELIKFCFRMRDAIQDIREENARLRKALKPFAAPVKDFRHSVPDRLVVEEEFTLGQLRAAAAAIREEHKDD